MERRYARLVTTSFWNERTGLLDSHDTSIVASIYFGRHIIRLDWSGIFSPRYWYQFYDDNHCTGFWFWMMNVLRLRRSDPNVLPLFSRILLRSPWKAFIPYLSMSVRNSGNRISIWWLVDAQFVGQHCKQSQWSFAVCIVGYSDLLRMKMWWCSGKWYCALMVCCIYAQ